MKIKSLLFSLLLASLLSCNTEKQEVDIIIINAEIHTMISENDIENAIAIKDGIIVEIGSDKKIIKKYSSDRIIDAKRREMYPGFTDCHGHILSLVKQKLNVDLTGSQSYFEMLARMEKFQAKFYPEIIIGRGWDHSLWGEKDLPDNKRLNEAFPKTPIALTRVDGHAMLINNAMMKLMGINEQSKIDGGAYLKKNGKLTGIILDNAVDELNKRLPKIDASILTANFFEIQEYLISKGLTCVHDAGLDEDARDFFIKLAEQNKLKFHIYGMLFPTDGNLDFVKSNGIYQNGLLTLRSFKMIADGSLGSRSACLIEPYSDDLDNHGILVSSQKEMKEKFQFAKEVGFQMNVHCIGDSANRLMMQTAEEVLAGEKDHRWRIEHAQVIHKGDIENFKRLGLIPSVQPTHATTDQRWAIDRLGEERLNHGAYAYNSLLQNRGLILFGTDFPIEDYDPFATIYAAVARKDLQGNPQKGFLKNEAVTTFQAIEAMTKWAAFGSFDEDNYGVLKKGMRADIVILDFPIKLDDKFHSNTSWMTIVNGKIVYKGHGLEQLD